MVHRGGGRGGQADGERWVSLATRRRRGSLFFIRHPLPSTSTRHRHFRRHYRPTLPTQPPPPFQTPLSSDNRHLHPTPPTHPPPPFQTLLSTDTRHLHPTAVAAAVNTVGGLSLPAVDVAAAAAVTTTAIDGIPVSDSPDAAISSASPWCVAGGTVRCPSSSSSDADSTLPLDPQVDCHPQG